jgi:peptide/nickel transport system ATP-binding protein
MTAVLELDRLAVSYRSGRDRRRVVHDVSFSVEPGEVVAVVGESGSGKSTTAHAIIGLLAAGGAVDHGRVLLGGTDIAGWSSRRLEAVRGARIGLIPQDPSSSLNPVRPIGVQVAEVLRIHRRGPSSAVRARVLDLLERVGLDDPALRASQYPHELSGGMRQRVLIAIAIALEPELIIADEPTSALDVTVQRRVLDLIDDLRGEFGTSVLLVTHDLGVAADRAGRVVVMKDGAIVEQGETSALLASPRDPYTRRLLADAPSLSRAEFRAPKPPLFLRDAATAAAEDPFAVVATGLTKEFRVGGRREPFRAVDDVSFSILRGTTHSIVGESGSGKTTTARMVARFVDPDAGSIRIDGEDVATVARAGRRELRRTVQLVYQNPFGSLDPRQSVEAIVAEPLHNFRIGDRAARRARALELLDRVALPASVAGRTPRELSGGQRQRVAIARALAIDPRVVILDEAVSALDVTVQSQILTLLGDLQNQLGLTYLFISHDLAVVRQISHTVSVMSHGRIVETGTTAEVFASPQHDYTRELLSAVPGRERETS